MTRGFLILAENTTVVDYVRCAEALAIGIRRVMPQANITLLSSIPSNGLFDQVLPLPYGDLAPHSDWKLINDWQAYEASPYDQTIKLEADMWIPRSIEHWWDTLDHRDIVVSSTIRNFKGEISACRFYRKFIDDNALPDAYNAITYFRKSPMAEKFFQIVRDIFENWSDYRAVLKCNPQEPVTTDWVYALTCHILGRENTMLPTFTEMSMTHMKQQVNDLQHEKWTDSLIYECLPEVFRINNHPQFYPVHYHVKSFCDVLLKEYGHD